MYKTTIQSALVKASPEIEVLLCCAKTQIESETAEHIRSILSENINWGKLIEMAQHQKVLPLLYFSLSSTFSEVVPKAILSKLRMEFLAQTRRSLLLSGELVKLLNLFAAEKISALPFKGPVLAASAYGNLSLRQFSDLDILVHPKDIEKAKQIFLSQGYSQKIERIEVTEAQKAAFVRSQSIYKLVREAAYPFIHPETELVVELHWGVMPNYFSFPIDSEALWQDLESVTIAGQSVPNLSPENTLLMLAGHGTKDCWTNLARICDVAELIRSHPQLNWEKLLEQASIKGGQRILFLALTLARNLLGTALPDEVWQKIQTDPKVSLLAVEVSQILFQKTDGSFQDGRVTRFHLSVRERLQDKILYCWCLVTTPTTSDWLILPLAEFPAFIYYLLRPIRLVREQVLKKINQNS
ncbi:nucleotidyltransferase domain-containing protein [Anabaena catenula]|uniref:Nucleotidyltransferase family protein n=1 Tax=Anabaena catenula FACHB-362 TaxID=2692877 RepID=A0ABR8J1H7_9NOST|nr:nucleotidyltransferase family protein [Anabaena catenula]MBD2691960.1 nucleotidyltransferase family protein [Anabaena catenula FACHB-362]